MKLKNRNLLLLAAVFMLFACNNNSTQTEEDEGDTTEVVEDEGGEEMQSEPEEGSGRFTYEDPTTDPPSMCTDVLIGNPGDYYVNVTLAPGTDVTSSEVLPDPTNTSMLVANVGPCPTCTDTYKTIPLGAQDPNSVLTLVVISEVGDTTRKGNQDYSNASDGEQDDDEVID